MNITPGIKRKYLNFSEVKALLDVLKQGGNPERDVCMAFLSFIHGFRASEVCSLRISDVSLSDRNIFVRRLKNGLTTTHPLINEEIEVIKKWLIKRSSHSSSGSEWLFISRVGNKLSRQQLYNIISSAGKKAGINIKVHPHMLRHACGYALANMGANTRLIQDYLGHKNIRHTVWYTASNSDRFYGIWKGEFARQSPDMSFFLY